jgi:hypothetical protein
VATEGARLVTALLIEKGDPKPVEIRLAHGIVALVDADDAHLASLRWCVYRHGRTWYARRTVSVGGKQRVVRLHREVLRAEPHQRVDHINGDGLDCRRSNLRFASVTENNQNCRKPKSNTSGFKGVSWHKRDSRWMVNIGVGGRIRHVGSFTRIEDAARAYDSEARALFGSFAALNFPGPGERAA